MESTKETRTIDITLKIQSFITNEQVRERMAGALIQAVTLTLRKILSQVRDLGHCIYVWKLCFPSSRRRRCVLVEHFEHAQRNHYVTARAMRQSE